MRYEVDHKAKTRKRIIRKAARQFREQGLEGAGVATVMKSAGLTVGGFYKHFRSKDDLRIEAIAESLQELRDTFLSEVHKAPPGEGWKAIVRQYLSLEHCENVATGCPMVALAPEIARSSPAVKARLASLMKQHAEQVLPFMPGRNRAEQARNQIVLMSAVTGAVGLARMETDQRRKLQILNTVRDRLLESF
jgi:TetR/AcrR family transcriptional regulator, transcriptional repressor for nem operon